MIKNNVSGQERRGDYVIPPIYGVKRERRKLGNEYKGVGMHKRWLQLLKKGKVFPTILLPIVSDQHCNNCFIQVHTPDLGVVHGAKDDNLYCL